MQFLASWSLPNKKQHVTANKFSILNAAASVPIQIRPNIQTKKITP
jgi:hypothetical protein